MKTNDHGLAIIKTFEGLRLKVYLCPANYPTVGYGHRILAEDALNIGNEITRQKADEFLAADLKKFETGVAELVAPETNENQFSALVSLAFNVGLNALKKSKLLKYHNDAEYSKAVKEFDWDSAGGKILEGLVRRRHAERCLYRGDIYALNIEMYTPFKNNELHKSYMDLRKGKRK